MIIKMCESCYNNALASKTAWLIKEEELCTGAMQNNIKELIQSRASLNTTSNTFKNISLSESGDFVIRFAFTAVYGFYGILITGEDAVDVLKIIEPILLERARKYQNVVSRVSPNLESVSKTKTEPPPEIKLPRREV